MVIENADPKRKKGTSQVNGRPAHNKSGTFMNAASI